MDTPSRTTSGSGAGRRARCTTFGVVTLAGVAVTAVALSVAAERAHLRFDLTASGERSLSPKTRRELERLDTLHTLVLVYRGSSVNAESHQRVRDILTELSATTNRFRSVEIDLEQASGQREFEAFVAGIVAEDSSALASAESETKNALQRTRTIAKQLDSFIGVALLETAESIPTIDPDSDRIRVAVKQFGLSAKSVGIELERTAQDADAKLVEHVGSISFVRTDRSNTALLKSLNAAINTVRVIRSECAKALSTPKTGAQASDRLRALDNTLGRWIAECDGIIDGISKQKPSPCLRVIDALKSGSCALITGKGLIALNIDRILPPAEYVVEGSAAADQSRGIENLIATGLSALRAPLRPIIVLMHGEQRRFLDEVPIFERMIRRQVDAGIDVVEWATVIEEQEPVTTDIDSAGTRPKVYVVLCPDSSAKESGGLSGLQRADKLAAAADRMAQAGRSMLIGLNPSIAPSFGKPDSMNTVLSRFGVFAETGRPLIRSSKTPQGLSIETDRVVQPTDSSNPLAGAVRGLPTFLPWPIALTERPATDGASVSRETIHSLACDAETWGEARWSGIWITPREKRGLIAEGPKFESDRDLAANAGQANWTIGTAIQKTEAGGAHSRAVIVGSNSWYMDAVASQTASVDGRTVSAYPGNDEFFDASVLWLAGLDDLIAQSPTARATAVVVPMDERTQSLLRLSLILGMPIGVLFIGLLSRLRRR